VRSGDAKLPTAALERCVGDVARFASEVWGRRPLLQLGSEGFEDLLTLGDVDHLLTTTSLRVPLFRLVKDGEAISQSEYTKRARTGSISMTGLADPPKVLRLFSDGATIVLQSMHRYWWPLARFCRDLVVALGHSTQVNALVTPPSARGLAIHSDAHDVFVLQAFGRKHWEVYEPGRSEGSETPAMSIDLQPGGSLYLPKGTPHAARAQETLSGHLTVGILAATWADLWGDVLGGLRHEPQLEEPLPAGFHHDPEGFAREVAERIEEVRRWLDKVDPHEVATRATSRFLTTRPPLLRGVFSDLAKLDAVGQATVVARRPGSICEPYRRGGRLRVMLGDRELDMPGWLEPAVEWIRTSGPFPIRGLAGEVGNPASRLVLVRRLIREGLLEVVE